MNKIKKSIIELISPYMYENNWLFALYNEFNKSEFEYNSETYYIDDFDICYDITAVLKYIWNRWKLKLSCMTFDVFDLQDNLLWEIKINKPLHLYTEEEEKQLLNLLIKLKYE